jgi:hypothetical protein
MDLVDKHGKILNLCEVGRKVANECINYVRAIGHRKGVGARVTVDCSPKINAEASTDSRKDIID